MADADFLISKRETPEGKTLTDIVRLTSDRRRDELIRLLGGTAGSEAAAKLAEELFAAAQNYKQKRKSSH